MRNHTPPKSSRKRKRARVCQSREEAVARAVVAHMWDIATDWLNQSRHFARQAATRSFGFIIAATGKASWEFHLPAIYFDRYNTVPESWIPVNGRTPEQCDEKNKAHVQDMFRTFSELQFKARHQVKIVGGTGNVESGSTEDGETRELVVTVNILDEALKFLTNFFQLKSPYELLRLSRDTCRFVFIVGMSIGRILDRCIEKMCSGAGLAELQKFISGSGLVVEGESTRENLINKHLLHLTPAAV